MTHGKAAYEKALKASNILFGKSTAEDRKQLDENTWLFSARCEVDEVNKDFNLTLPEGEYNTLSGLVMFVAEDIPEVNAILQLEAYTITIMDAEENKVNTVKVRKR